MLAWYLYRPTQSRKTRQEFNLMKSALTKLIQKHLIERTVKWLIWDFDGTLWSDERISKKLEAEYRNFLLEKLEQPISSEEFKRLTDIYGSWSAATEKLTKIPEIEVLDIIDERFDVTRYLTKNPQIIELVLGLNNYKHLILSNSKKERIVKGLVKIGFQNINHQYHYPFETIFDRKKTKSLKPNQKIYQIICHYTKAPKYAHLAIGDSIHHDIEPARKYGFRAIHVDKFLKLYQNSDRISLGI